MSCRINSVSVRIWMAHSHDLRAFITRFDAVHGKMEGFFLVWNTEFCSNGSCICYSAVTNGAFLMRRVQDDFTSP
jgi:hypothetical protein